MPKAATQPSTDVVDINTPRTAIVPFRGENYGIPKDRGDWSLDVMELLEETPPKFVAALHLLLGDEQWAAWRSRHKTLSEANDMYLAIAEVTGGNS